MIPGVFVCPYSRFQNCTLSITGKIPGIFRSKWRPLLGTPDTPVNLSHVDIWNFIMEKLCHHKSSMTTFVMFERFTAKNHYNVRKWFVTETEWLKHGTIALLHEAINREQVRASGANMRLRNAMNQLACWQLYQLDIPMAEWLRYWLGE